MTAQTTAEEVTTIGLVGILLVAAIVGLTALDAIISGYTLATLWGWFIVPFGVAPIGIAWAIGLSLVAGSLKTSRMPIKEEKVNFGLFLFATLILKPALLLGIGYVAKGYM